MDEPLTAAEQRAIALGTLVKRTMDPATAAVELAQIARRHRTRQTARAAGVAVLALVGLVLFTQTSRRPAHVALADGTTVHALSDDLDVAVRETATATLFELARGSARFDVTPRHRRPVRVQAGAVVVEVLGTRFDVERTADAVTVAVQSGRVRVRSPKGEAFLEAGDRSVFAARPSMPASTPTPTAIRPPSVAPAVVPAPVTVAVLPAPAASDPRRAARRSRDATPQPVARTVASDWKQLAQAGKFKAAHKVLPTRVDGVDALFLAADVARRAGDRKAALVHLGAILRRHPKDARASLAAFTIGRLSDDAKAAAEAFDQAFRLAPRGAMAGDALTRAAEAWQRAGAIERAKARAKTALEFAPDPRRAARLRAILAQ